MVALSVVINEPGEGHAHGRPQRCEDVQEPVDDGKMLLPQDAGGHERRHDGPDGDGEAEEDVESDRHPQKV